MKGVPKTVTASVLLISVPSLAWLIVAIRAVTHSGKYLPLSLLLVLAACVVVVGVTSLLVLAIYKRQNWVRWLLAALVLLRIVSFAFLFFSPKYPATFAVVAPFAPYVLATILLFLPSASAWFRPNNSFKPKPLRGSA